MREGCQCDRPLKERRPHVDVDVAAAKEKFQKTKLKLVHKNWMTKTHSLMLDSFSLGIVSKLNIFRFLSNSDTTSLFWQSSFFNRLFFSLKLNCEHESTILASTLDSLMGKLSLVILFLTHLQKLKYNFIIFVTFAESRSFKAMMIN